MIANFDFFLFSFIPWHPVKIENAVNYSLCFAGDSLSVWEVRLENSILRNDSYGLYQQANRRPVTHWEWRQAPGRCEFIDYQVLLATWLAVNCY